MGALNNAVPLKDYESTPRQRLYHNTEDPHPLVRTTRDLLHDAFHRN